MFPLEARHMLQAAYCKKRDACCDTQKLNKEHNACVEYWKQGLRTQHEMSARQFITTERTLSLVG